MDEAASTAMTDLHQHYYYAVYYAQENRG